MIDTIRFDINSIPLSLRQREGTINDRGYYFEQELDNGVRILHLDKTKLNYIKKRHYNIYELYNMLIISKRVKVIKKVLTQQ